MFTEGLLFNLATAVTFHVHFRSLLLMCKLSLDIGKQDNLGIAEGPWRDFPPPSTIIQASLTICPPFPHF